MHPHRFLVWHVFVRGADSASALASARPGTSSAGLLPFYAEIAQLRTFTILRQYLPTFTKPPPYVETFGGLGPELCAWLKRLATERQNKLNKREYDDTTWAARSWRSYAAQQISVSVHRTVAMEIAQALGLSGAADERPVM